MNRPLVWVAAAFVGGSCAGAFGWIPNTLWSFAPAVAGVLAPLIVRPRWSGPASVALVFFAAGALLWHLRDDGAIGDPLSTLVASRPESARYTLVGVVEQPDIYLPGEDYMQFFLRVRAVGYDGGSNTIAGGVVVRWSDPGFAIYAGETVRVHGPLELDLARVNPDTPSVEDYFRRQDIHTMLRIYGPAAVTRIEVASARSIAYWASVWRGEISLRLSRALPESATPFVLTVLVGDRRRMDSETYRDFVNSGTAHVLSVSGVHMAIVYVSLSFVLGMTLRHKRLRAAIIMLAVFAFAIIAGARVASMRAALMIAMYVLADIFEREPDAPTALSVAALVFVGIDPDVLFDGGFQLTFLSIASLLLFREPIKARLERAPYFLREALATSLAVQILPLPAAIAMFHVVPLASPAANLLVVPLVTLVLWLAVMTAAAAFVAPAAATVVGFAALAPVWLIEAVARGVSVFDSAYLLLTSPTLAAIGCYFVAAIFFALALRSEDQRRRYHLLAAGAAAVLCVVLWSPWSQPAELTFLDVGHGDATFIRTPTGKTILVDGGDRTELADLGERVVAPFLWSNHVSRIDAVVATHDDRDHIGGLSYIVRHFRVGAVYVPPIRGAGMAELLAFCEAEGVEVRTLAEGDTLHGLEVLHPPQDWPHGGNESSIVLRIRWPGFDALLTGDVEDTAEARLAALDVKATVLKSPHHGSITSSADAFLDAVGPRVVVISTGRRVGGKVTSAEVLRRYGERGATVYRTDFHGGIRLRTASPLAIEAARPARRFPHRE